MRSVDGGLHVGRGLTRAQKIRIGLAFTTAEVTMTVIGVAIGTVAGHLLGDVAGYLGFFALVCVGAYMVYESLKESEEGFDLSKGWGLLLKSPRRGATGMGHI